MASLQLDLTLLIIASAIVSLLAQYEGYPSKSAPALQQAFKRSVTLKCLYHGLDKKGEFVEWFRIVDGQNVSVNNEKARHYAVRHTEQESTLEILFFVKADANVSKWFVTTKKAGQDGMPVECQFDQITPIPSPQGMIDDKNEKFNTSYVSTRRTEGQVMNLKCRVDPQEINPANRVLWQYSADNQTYGAVPDGTELDGDELHIQSVERAHRGYYRCSLNNVDYTIFLRVKDRLAALWPFLGILAVVLVLVIIILIFEKRQKSNKKSGPIDDDEQDRPSDPLVRTTVKSTDNDNKKRTVKA